jgi:hypothetical protein
MPLCIYDQVINMIKEVEVVLQLHTSLTTTLNESEWSSSRFIHFSAIWIGGWVGFRNGLVIVTEKIVILCEN